MKLGKHAPKEHPKTLEFAKYLTKEPLEFPLFKRAPGRLFHFHSETKPKGGLPQPSSKVYREYMTPDEAKQMFGNDAIGDCTCAGAANLLILWTCHTGQVVIPTLDDVVGMYSAITGYDPKQALPDGSNPTDNGAAMTDVLAYLQSTGLAGHKILAWAKIDHTNLQQRRTAVDLFGGTYVGVQLPQSAMDQFRAGQNLEVVPGSPVIGGHAIIHPGYGALGGDYVTWAKWDVKASGEWEAQYIDEEYVVLTEDWIKQATQRTPGGLDLATLKADLQALAA